MARFAIPPMNWEEALVAYPMPIQTIPPNLSAVVRAALPEATESDQGAKMMGHAQYWMTNKQDVRAMISPDDHHVKLYIRHVTADPTGALKVEGTGKNARQVKLRDGPAGDIRNLLRAVVAARG